MRRWPILVRGLVIGICGILLALGGCLGFMESFNSGGSWGLLGAAAFVIGALALLAGGVMVVIGVFKWLFAAFGPKPEPGQE